MPSRRPAALLAPLIALVLIGGVIAAVVGGSDTDGTDLAQQPGETESSASPEPETEPSPDAQPSDGAQPTPEASSSPVPESSPDGGDPDAVASEQAIPRVGATPMPEPSASPTGAPGGTTPGGTAPGVQDPTALTGGWVGGTPNTGTAISALGLLLLALGGGLVWLRRART